MTRCVACATITMPATAKSRVAPSRVTVPPLTVRSARDTAPSVANEPALTGWQAHAHPFDFEPEQDYAEGAARFLTGTPNVRPSVSWPRVSQPGTSETLRPAPESSAAIQSNACAAPAEPCPLRHA